MDRFKDKTAIVTGGASGIGRALCEELGRRGAVVVATDINAKSAGEVASAIASTGGRAHAAYLDVSRAQDAQRLIEEVVSENGRLDYLSSIKMMDAATCARIILRGVARNKGVILVTGFMRLSWLLYRLHPGLLVPMCRRMAQEFQALRSES